MIDGGRLMIEDGWWKRNDLYCLPGKAWGDGVLTPETSSRVTRSACGVFQTLSVKQRRFFSTLRR